VDRRSDRSPVHARAGGNRSLRRPVHASGRGRDRARRSQSALLDRGARRDPPPATGAARRVDTERRRRRRHASRLGRRTSPRRSLRRVLRTRDVRGGSRVVCRRSRRRRRHADRAPSPVSARGRRGSAPVRGCETKLRLPDPSPRRARRDELHRGHQAPWHADRPRYLPADVRPADEDPRARHSRALRRPHRRGTPGGLVHRAPRSSCAPSQDGFGRASGTAASLASVGIGVPADVPRRLEVDLLDAAAAAWSAGRYAKRTAKPLPETHAERIGAIWR
jgi:hypothetical protein